MNISTFMQKIIAERKIEILQKQKLYVEQAIKNSKTENSFCIQNSYILQKEVEVAIKNAGYVSKKFNTCVQYSKFKYDNNTFSKCLENLMLEKFNLNMEYNNEQDDDNVTANQRKKIQESIIKAINNMEDYEFRFPYIRIEFSLSFSRTRLNKNLKKELYEAGFRENNSSFAIVSDFTGAFKL